MLSHANPFHLASGPDNIAQKVIRGSHGKSPCLEAYTISALTFPVSAADRLKCLGVIARFVTRTDRYRSLAPQVFKHAGRRKSGGAVTTPTPVH
jgi:hypothetical protein